MAHQTVRGARPTVLPSASCPPWVRPFLDLEFRDQGAKKCFEQILSTVLSDPTPGDMTIRATLDLLNQFFDYTNPFHPWQIDRQLIPEDPFIFSMEGFDPLAPVSKRAPLETRIRRRWTRFRGDGPKPDLGFALWERRFCILAATVEKGFTAEEAEPNRDKNLIKAKRTRFRVLMEMIIEPSVPWSSGELAVYSQDKRLAEVTALVDRQPWRANRAYRPFGHPYNTT
ncbi:hypothetical protein L915_19084 [Phytophthora nicotianae]|uniref:Uncharacterized protein n=1 Tax=Phytophthora nicotianae TaxID=4792 RepID=W2FTD0_PHYNI|nr:hypothetical protein L915_19084 [Phytophthora nicotianae]